MRRLVTLALIPICLALAASPSAAATCDGALHPAPPTGLGGIRELEGVSATAVDNVWVVGRRWEPSYAYANAFALRWDGAAWIRYRLPHPRKFDVKAVVAFSPTDVWAAGRTQGSTGADKYHSTIQHWNGISWSETLLRTGAGVVWDIDGTGPRDIWIVGQRYRQTYSRPVPLVWHFDGVTWSRHDLGAPDPGSQSVTALTDVSALAVNDVWAVGRFGDTARTYAVHWDGVGWSTVATPNPGTNTTNNALVGVEANGPDDVWAVGESGPDPLALHFDGTAFTRVTLPAGMGSLIDVSAVASDDVWAVGRSYASFPPGGLPAAAHWDGSAWSGVAVEAAPEDGLYQGVAALPSGDVTAVGMELGGPMLLAVACAA